MFSHNRILTMGIALITLTLASLYLFSDQSPRQPAELSQATSSTAALFVAASEGTLPQTEKSPSDSKKPVEVTQVTVTMSPRVSPVSPSVSPMSPRVSPSPIVASSTPVSSTSAPIPSMFGRIVINEIGWMGTDAFAADEWIELYNAGTATVDLSGWKLSAADGSPKITLSGSIAPGDFYLIERTDDQTIVGIDANLKTSFGNGLGNGGESLRLVNDSGEVMDEAGTTSGWFAGSNSPRTSMERVQPNYSGLDPANWATSTSVSSQGKASNGAVIRGTPKERNSTQQ